MLTQLRVSSNLLSQMICETGPVVIVVYTHSPDSISLRLSLIPDDILTHPLTSWTSETILLMRSHSMLPR